EIIENIISKNQIANTSGISKTLLERNNIYFYLKSNDGVEITNSQINKPLNGLAINKVINPTAFIVNVVVETSFASYVYICDFEIVIEPKVNVTLGTNVSAEPGKLFTYNANIKYEYESENKILVKDLVEVAGKEIDSISILNSKNDKAEDIDLTETLSNYETSILTIGADCITLNINTSYNIYFDLKVEYKDGFVIVIKITYQKWENLNELRAYSLGWNGETFDNRLEFAELIPNYNGTATAVRSDKANSLSGAISVINEYLVFNLYETKQTVELTITLDILGNPSYNFVITLNHSYNVSFSQGWAQENSASTVLEATKSKLDLTISNTYTQNGYIEFILKNNTDILNIKVASSNILGEIGFKALDGISTTEYFSTNSLYTFGNSGSLNIEFIETALDINGILTISINEYETIEVFITISQTYTLESNYKIDHDYKVGDKTLNLDYETFEVKSSITIEEFITNLNTIENPVKINQNRLVFKTLIDSNVVVDDENNDKIIDIYKTLFLTAGKNKLQAEIYYETLSGLVIDSNLAYASVVGETIRFIDDGIIYLRLFNETGVDCYYKIIIQQPENFYSTIIYDEKVENENYLCTTLSELKTGVKIANIKFIPTNELYFNITALDVTNAQVDYRNGSFENTLIKINWKVNDNYEIILSSSLDGTLEMTSFTINFITINA
ncbi:MAG: hypothetical protein IJX26_01335, partial [Clostridia bacterium]|nr:hypothetical protein [Clostridia bacterium]